VFGVRDVASNIPHTDGTMCPGVDSASRNEYQGFPLGGEGGRCVRLTTYHPRSAERQENPEP
jgi:hypothetical protein